MLMAVMGCGYLGAVHAAAMATLGWDVVGVDIEPTRIAALSRGQAPFHEPGFPDLLAAAIESGRLRFTTDAREAAGADLVFLCVGTPQLADGHGADLSYLDAAVATLTTLPWASPPLVVGKSTVPVGTAARLAKRLANAVPGTGLVWNPEFLREGYAVNDTLHPDRIVYGVGEGPQGQRDAARLDEAYRDLIGRQAITRLVTDYATAELVKVAANAFLATKISFVNAMAEICDKTGADVTTLARAIGMDERIGPRFLRAGVGFGGGCLPKDIRAFRQRAAELGTTDSLGFLAEVERINLRQRTRMVDLTTRVVGGDLENVRLAVLGGAFKPDSDDIRDSPALEIATALARRGARVSIVDPAAGPAIRAAAPQLEVHDRVESACAGARAVLLLTEWREFVDLDPAALAPVVAERRILDGRTALDPARWRDAGWEYHGLGRPAPVGQEE